MIEFLLPGSRSRKLLGIMPAAHNIIKLALLHVYMSINKSDAICFSKTELDSSDSLIKKI